MQTIKIKIEGRVQGVFFRQEAKDKADKLGIKGKVMNCDDDSVEIIATGEKGQLESLVEWCRKGPSKAVVTNVITQELPLQSFLSFSIAYF